MEVVELKNPKALLVPAVAGLFKRGFESVHFAAPGGFDSVAPDVYEYVESDGYFVFIGAEDGQFKSLAMGFYPSGNLFPYPTVVLVYNEGSPALRVATIRKMVDNLLERGYTSLWAINASEHDTKVWQRLFHRGMGGTSRVIGEVVEFSV